MQCNDHVSVKINHNSYASPDLFPALRLRLVLLTAGRVNCGDCASVSRVTRYNALHRKGNLNCPLRDRLRYRCGC